MNLKSCCWKALKHHETICPVCNVEIFGNYSKEPEIDVEKDGQIVLLFNQPRQLSLKFNQKTR